MSGVLDRHCPVIQREVVVRPNTAWFTAEMKSEKRQCRKLERQYKRTGLTIHHDMYKLKRNEVHQMREQAKVEFYNSKIESTQNQKDLFKLIASISGTSAT